LSTGCHPGPGFSDNSSLSCSCASLPTGV
jgi:hypothetical protein